MVDAHALGACGLGRAGSNPASPTKEPHALRIGWRPVRRFGHRFDQFVWRRGQAVCDVLRFAENRWRLCHEEALRLENPQSNR